MVRLQDKIGIQIPKRGARVTIGTYDSQIAKALEPYARLKSGPKILADLAEATERAALNWMRGACGPQARVLIRLMARDPAVQSAVLDLVEEQRRIDAAIASRHARRDGAGSGPS